MDRTHVVLFDWETAHALIGDAGLVVAEACSVGGSPGSRWVPSIRSELDTLATKVAPGLFGVQFVFVATRPSGA
jgi:hypothetical protein